jgi:hypothetical protein
VGPAFWPVGTVVETVVTLGKKRPKIATIGNNRNECLGRCKGLDLLDLIGSPRGTPFRNTNGEWVALWTIDDRPQICGDFDKEGLLVRRGFNRLISAQFNTLSRRATQDHVRPFCKIKLCSRQLKEQNGVHPKNESVDRPISSLHSFQRKRLKMN